jgi:hypothetical protein
VQLSTATTIVLGLALTFAAGFVVLIIIGLQPLAPRLDPGHH